LCVWHYVSTHNARRKTQNMKETEFGYIKWIQKHLKYSPEVLVGSGDDAAVVQIGKNNQVCITTDTIVENVDFHLSSANPAQIGHKSVAISISDLAAMGGGFSKIYASSRSPRVKNWRKPLLPARFFKASIKPAAGSAYSSSAAISPQPPGL